MLAITLAVGRDPEPQSTKPTQFHHHRHSQVDIIINADKLLVLDSHQPTGRLLMSFIVIREDHLRCWFAHSAITRIGRESSSRKLQAYSIIYLYKKAFQTLFEPHGPLTSPAHFTAPLTFPLSAVPSLLPFRSPLSVSALLTSPLHPLCPFSFLILALLPLPNSLLWRAGLLVLHGCV